MRKLVLLSLLLAAVVARGQGIKPGTLWYDGANCFTASVLEGGIILMQAMDEGQELEFQMVPVEGKANVYTVAPGLSEYADSPFEAGMTMKYRHQEGMKVVCVYDPDNRLETVLIWTPDDKRHNNVWTWIPQIKGRYVTDPYGYEVVIGDNVVTMGNVEGTYEVQTFNDIVNRVIKVEGTEADGYWEFAPTVKGFNVYAGNFDEYGLFERADGPYTLVWSDQGEGRFSFANTLLLNRCILSRYKRSTLRLMRNSILAHHGYVFQSKDLKDYFGGQAWYNPAETNSDVKLSFVEQLNVEMIKTAEADPDHEEYTSEE